jgi:acyl-coenzyme A synthetase/AMP-(fatty) acid ligase
MSYYSDFRDSLEKPTEFWAEQALKLDWIKPPETVLYKDEQKLYRWFKGGQMNTSHLALDYHVENGRADQPALIYDSPVTNTIQTYTYRELRDEVARFAGVLREKGVQKGDTVIIYMPMIPQAAIAMLACARLGAIHSVVFGGFAAHELAIRIDDAKPKVLLTASGGMEITRVIDYMAIVNKALEEASHRIENCIVYQRPFIEAPLKAGRDWNWNTLLNHSEPVDYIPLDPGDPLYILYTSGTTGKPKGIMRENGGHAVALKYSMEKVYDVQPGDVYWAASDIGWVVGHSYIIYAPLIRGCTTVLYEGKPIKTPDAGAFWRVIEQHQVKVLFTAPTAFRAIRKVDSQGSFLQKYQLGSLKYLFLAGERCDISTLNWLENLLGIPVIDHWWQTESGWPMLANMPGYELIPVKPGSAGKPVCGYDIQILSPDGEPLGPGQEGAVAIKLPLPPGCLPNLWQNTPRFIQSYLSPFPGYYFSGDGGYKDEDGYFFITGRMDDIINVAGHRLSTAEMEEVVAAHPAIAECAVIGVKDNLKGEIPIGFAVLKSDIHASSATIEAEVIQMVRDRVGPVASFKKLIIADRLPKTRSGKILRKIMRHIANGESYAAPSTIEDRTVLPELTDTIQSQLQY